MRRKKTRNTACAIGIIGGADGPTAIYLSSQQEEDAFLQQAAQEAVPNLRPFSDLIAYLQETYQAVEYPLHAREMEMLKVNVILNHYPHLLTLPPSLPAKPTRRQIRRYVMEDTSFAQAREYPAKQLGLVMRGYRVPAAAIRQKLACDCEEDAVVKMELKSEYLCVENGGGELLCDLILWRGVSKEDIAEKTPRFIGYAHAKKEHNALLMREKSV